MRRAALLFAAISFVLVGAACYFLASQAVRYVEEDSEGRLTPALQAAGQNWATIRANGLEVVLTGLAPDEASRFRALEIMGQIIDSNRVENKAEVLQASGIEAPRFTLEVLRNVDKVSLIGLVPERTGRTSILSRIEQIGQDVRITDMLESADHPIPSGWEKSLEYGLASLELLPRSKVSITSDRVKVTAVSDTHEEKDTIEQLLSDSKPEGISLILDISAPRPVISPFRFRMTMENGIVQLPSCSADTIDTHERILKAVKRAGLERNGICEIGLGVPTTDWAKAIVMAVEAVSDLKGGVVTFTDSDISLIANDDVTQSTFDRVIGRLENALPGLFSLHAVLPPKIAENGQSGEIELPEFIATRSPEGLVQLRGRVPSQLTKEAIGNYSAALFGDQNVFNQTRIDQSLPDGWPVRVLAGLDGLSQLHHGSLLVQPEVVEIKGTGALENVADEVSKIFSVRIGGKQNYKIDIEYDENLAPKEVSHDTAECQNQIKAVLQGQQITFAPSSANIEASSLGVIDAIADILRNCEEAAFEIGGHTDSQGSEEMNQSLSQVRAEAVLGALLDRRIVIAGLAAKGYGESLPISDNETDAGRQANRRIEFQLVGQEEDTPNE